MWNKKYAKDEICPCLLKHFLRTICCSLSLIAISNGRQKRAGKCSALLWSACCSLLGVTGDRTHTAHAAHTHTHTTHAGQGMGYECKSSWLCWLLNPLWSRLNENATHNFDTNETCHFACQLTVCPFPFDSTPPLPPHPLALPLPLVVAMEFQISSKEATKSCSDKFSSRQQSCDPKRVKWPIML